VKIGSITVDPPIVLAPIAGITDRYFRPLVKKMGGCGLMVTEMVSADGLTRGNRQARALAVIETGERPVGVQLFGHCPETLAKGAAEVEAGGADFVDINMGCPARKVTARGGGASLLKDPALVNRITAAVTRTVDLPVTVKIRSGWDANTINMEETGKAAEDGGASAVTLHPRTRRDCFRGQADWRLIARLKEVLKIPVIGNGDIQYPEDGRRMMEETGCDGIMIGRGALKNPWLLKQTSAYLAHGRYDPPSLEERRALFLQYYHALDDVQEEKWKLHKMRKFSGWFTKGMSGGAAFRREINLAGSAAGLLDLAEALFRPGGPEAV
jgi:tRNA-dihydrouridine synthase B